MEDQAHPAGHYWVGSVRDITVNPGPEGDAKSVTGELFFTLAMSELRWMMNKITEIFLWR